MNPFDKNMSPLVTGSEKEEEKKVEHAIFFVSGESVYLLHAVGVIIESDLDAGLTRDGEAGPWSEIPKEDGIWVWEGIPGWHGGFNAFEYDDGGEPDYTKRGKARRLSEEEFKLIQSGPIDKLFGPSRWPPGSEDEEEKAPT